MAIAPNDRSRLIELARAAVAADINGEPLPSLDEQDAAGVLGERRGCFVTLTNGDHLRGCIGTFQPREPLAQSVVEMASQAARDPRFVDDPIAPTELDHLTIEVSVLSPLTITDKPEHLKPGLHGIYVVNGYRSGCFLPEVATDMGWTAEEFLSYCCAHKAGLPPDAWRSKSTQVYLFTSEKFSQ